MADADSNVQLLPYWHRNPYAYSNATQPYTYWQWDFNVNPDAERDGDRDAYSDPGIATTTLLRGVGRREAKIATPDSHHL